MESYPRDLVDRHHPLIFLSGFDVPHESHAFSQNKLQKDGFRIGSDSPPIRGDRADQLRNAFQSLDVAADLNSQLAQTSASQPARYAIETCPRVSGIITIASSYRN